MTVAAIYVHERGPYVGLDGVDCYGRTRDARLYHGPFPVVAHPPCARWGRYWFGGPSARVRLIKGDDGGCFEAALSAVRRFGGVLEHPADSYAWEAFRLRKPPRDGGWVAADFDGGWTCCVEQGWYGHRARKATWLYAVATTLPSLQWGPSPAMGKIDAGCHSTEERRRRTVKTGIVQILSKKQREVTPIPFRDVLLDIARSARRDSSAAG